MFMVHQGIKMPNIVHSKILARVAVGAGHQVVRYLVLGLFSRSLPLAIVRSNGGHVTVDMLTH